TIGSASGTGLGNYSVSYVNGSLTVSPKALTVTADADASAGNGQTAFSKVYGSALAFAGTEFTTSGLVNGAPVTSATRSGARAAPRATATGRSSAVTIGSASGTGLGNYSVSYVNGTLNVSPKALTVTADADASAGNGQTAFSKVYGSALAFAGTEF